MLNQTTLWAEGSRREELLIHSASGHAIYMLDPTGIVSTWNQGALNIKGYSADEVIGRHFSLFYVPEDREKGEPDRSLNLAVALGQYEAEGWRLRKDGSRFWASIIINPIYQQGELIGFAKVTRDISRQHDAEERLAQANRHMDIALSCMVVGLMLHDSSGQLILANRRVNELFSLSPDALRRGMHVIEVMEVLGFTADQAELIDRELRQHGTSPWRSLQETESGHIVLMVTRTINDGERVFTFEDVSVIQQAELMLGDLACLDPLTGLAHRTFFRSRLNEAIAQGKRGIPFALLLLDMKDFSAINELLGESTADELLKAVAQRLKEQVREVDTVARLEGNTFAILQSNPHEPRDTEMLASRLMESLSIPHQIGGESLIAGANIGIALGGSDGSDANELLKNAGFALMRAKQSLFACYSFFNSEIDSLLRTQRALENDLYEASRLGQLSLHYQPIVDTQTGRVLGFEALLRWAHPTRGWVPPSEFVPLAEECGLIVSIGEWALRTACAQAATWPSPLYVAVNLSPVQFQDSRLPATVARALEMTGLEAHRLELEVTESLLLKDDEANLDILTQLREMRVRIALDDFGTGYSSLSYLLRFRYDKLKIDRSFIQDLPENGSAKAIVNSVIELGKSFGVSVVAEGVETQGQLEYLREHGCHQVQGYFLGMPLPPEELRSAALSPVDNESGAPL
jgi:diguanylate cyclase (GGDEF)-like protein/PAS domain S-box-containing protein